MAWHGVGWGGVAWHGVRSGCAGLGGDGLDGRANVVRHVMACIAGVRGVAWRGVGVCAWAYGHREICVCVHGGDGGVFAMT